MQVVVGRALKSDILAEIAVILCVEKWLIEGLHIKLCRDTDAVTVGNLTTQNDS